MSNIPTVGVFIPNGYLNMGSSPGPTGQQDAYGNNYPSGLNPGKVIELSTNGAQAVAAPGTDLYDGAYQWVLLDSGATAEYATEGLAAYIKLDSGATQGAVPETSYQAYCVTTEDQASSTALFAGVFLNPATVNGFANTPTPGQWIFIFVGAGRAQVQFGATLTNGSPALGDNIAVAGHAASGGNGYGTFDDQSTSGTAPTGTVMGKAATVPVAAKTGLIYVPGIISRIPTV